MRITKTRAAVLSLAASAATLAPAALTAASAGAVGSAPPTITAHPDNVMVNTTTKLVGHGSPRRHAPHRGVPRRRRGWCRPAPATPPTPSPSRPTGWGSSRRRSPSRRAPTSTTADTAGLSARCYIGVPSPSGIDTVSLQPYTAIVVTYP